MGDAMQNDAEKLFLLEVLVDNLLIQTDSSSPNLNKDLASNMADTCVMFQFLHYPPLVVCESDFIGTSVSNKDTSHITFKSGKSCFFSLKTPQGPILPVPFEVKVSVIRKMKEGVLPDKLELGKTTVDIGDSFTELLKQNTDENSDTSSLSKIKKGTFDIKDESGRKVGSITAFLRLSCFGKIIVTQFSLNKETEKSYLFKGTDLKAACKEELPVEKPHYVPAAQNRPQCSTIPGNPLRKPPIEPFSPWEQRQAEAYYPQSGPSSTRSVPQPGDPLHCYPKSSWPQTSRPQVTWEQSQVETFDPRLKPPNPTYSQNITQPGDPMRCYQNPNKSSPPRPLTPWEQSQVETFDPRLKPPNPTYSQNITQPGDPMRCYQNPNKSSSPRPLTPWEQSQLGAYDPRVIQPPTRIGREILCECPYPVSPASKANYSQKTDRNMILAPGEVGMQDDQVIFQLPLKKPGDPLSERDQQLDSQVYYKLTSAEETRDGMQKNTVNVKSDDIPGMATKAAVGPVSGLPVDEGHDVFLLKIGKKCEGDKKRNLELELRTPKMKEPKPPASDKDTQYLESDIPKTSKKSIKSKDKGKGKGKGKDKGKGKGKKGKK
ncbi:uncharacterized protein LOC129004790 [Macrosteles quadrilineatus]|uniref:uncharacterized protein LOC129004790 n=1 Tax=Macrosteles quadrilineatus TaxID=74068 RepID=UPI0023E22409|nr:uncharacterized protein LOC129004790 [Macrosteles quadrilineatus]